eukprot:jgi/Botrbrau1/7801/Bobra.0159s0229.1
MQGSRQRGRLKLLLLAVAVATVVGVTWTLMHPHTANPKKLDAARHSAARPIPKVALLFLSRGPMPLEAAWRDFMEAAASVQPIHPDTFIAWGNQDYVHKERKAQSRSQAGQLVSRKLAEMAQGIPPRGLAGPVPQAGSHRGNAVTALPGPQNVRDESANGRAATRTLFGQSGISDPRIDMSGVQTRGLMGTTSMHADIVFSRGHSAPCNNSWARRMRHGDDVIARQSMFSVYVHTAPGYVMAPSNLFYGYQIPDRTVVQWGQFSVAEAERRLLRAALRDQANERFVLLSEACVPLYPPHVLYTQLMYERRSRLDACAENTEADMVRRCVNRWDPAMRTLHLARKHWRKSSQWFVLSRELAAVVAHDHEVATVFEVECFSYLPDTDLDVPPHVQEALDANITIPKRECVADEHYVPTLLAMHGLESKTDCLGALMYTEWAHPMWSPKTFHSFEIDPDFVERLREKKVIKEGEFCAAGAAMRSAAYLFRRTSDGRSLASLEPSKGGWWESGGQYQALEPGCALFARKFDIAALDAVMRMGADCDRGFAWSSACINR